MKRKVAVFANGWSNEYLELVIEGVKKRAEEENVDLFVFVNYSSKEEGNADDIGERSIFTLPNIGDFDGAIMITNTFHSESERAYLNREVLKYGIPAVSFEYEMEGVPYLGTDTYSGVFELVTHVIEEHNARIFGFVSGPVDNAESQIRRKATEDALQRAGLSLSEENVILGNWSYYTVYEEILQRACREEKLPDAIICANDEMAIGVCAALDCCGIRVPEQVLVTGCDHIVMGQQFFPVLSTVEREWDKLGYEGMNLLLKQIEGQKVPERTTFHSAPVIGESCGCEVDRSQQEKRLHSIIGVYRKQRENSINEWHLRHIDDMLAKMTSVGDLKNTLRYNFEYNHRYEGNSFLICLVENYFSQGDGGSVLKPGEYSEQMEVYINLLDGKTVAGSAFPSKKLLPDYEGDSKESHVYMFVPLHMEERCIGYVMQKDNLQGLYEQTLYTWTKHVSQDLERVRQNVYLEALNQKLIEVSMTDALTGLRNRTGYDALAFPYLQKCQREGKNSAIVFADINRMKVINDQYGHLQGDLALCMVADAIKKTMPKDWIAVRYGGDEFIMVGECRDMEEAESIKERLADNLEELKKQQQIPFPLTASFGAVLIDPGEDAGMEEYLRKADEAMYEAKQKYHAAERK